MQLESKGTFHNHFTRLYERYDEKADVLIKKFLKETLDILDDKVLDVLQTKLTPSMREALSVMLGPEVANILDEIGLQEPQHLVPQSVIAQAFPANTIEESLEMFDRQLMDQQNIPSPPQGGLGGAPIMDVPQTNVPPVV